MSESYFDENGKFKHNIFAAALIQNLKVITVNGQLYVYEENYYQKSDKTIEKRMLDMYPTIKRSQRNEVMDYIKILTAVKREDIQLNEYQVNLKNTLLDVRTSKRLSFTPDVIEFTRIPVNYHPKAYSKDLDTVLDKVFCGDKEARALFEEMVGYMLIKNCKFRKGFLFYGGGSNGKSTILDLLKRFLGEGNYSTLELDKLTQRFMTAELEHMLANIGDDINKKEIVDTGTIKKLFTGESLTIDRKWGAPFVLKSHAKMVFSANEIPRIADKTHGMYSRLMLVPFNAKFSPSDSDFDPFIEEKISTEESLSYLLNLGLSGLQRLFKQNGFTNPRVVQDALEAYKTDNSQVLSWIAEEEISVDRLLTETTDMLFNHFKDYCQQSDIKSVSIRTFHKDIEDKYNFKRERCRSNIEGKYSWKFERK